MKMEAFQAIVEADTYNPEYWAALHKFIEGYESEGIATTGFIKDLGSFRAYEDTEE